MRSRWAYPLLLMSLLAVLLLAAAALSLPAQAQAAQCGGYADVLSDLERAYQEQVVWVGERGEAGQLVITAKPDGSTWTAMLVRQGVACLVSAGTGWKALAAGEDV